MPLRRSFGALGSVVDDLRSLDREAYTRATDAFVGALSATPGVLAVLQFGTVRFPGVSDLDLLVLCRDAEYQDVLARVRAETEALPEGGYLFWHPAAVVPLSLIEAAATLHTFRDPTLLWGDASPLEQAIERRDPWSQAVATMVWNTFFWRALSAVPLGDARLRGLLLLLGNCYQSVAANYDLVGEPRLAGAARAEAQLKRGALLAADGRDRRRMVQQALRDVTAAWHASERALQEWARPYLGELGARCPAGFALDRWRRVRFVDAPPRPSLRWLPPVPPRARPLMASMVTIDIEVPTVYAVVTRAVAPAYAGRATSWVSGVDCAEPGEPLRSGAARYRDAVEAVRRFSRPLGDEWATFGDLFVVPWGY